MLNLSFNIEPVDSRETLKPWQEDQSFNISAEFNSTVIEGLKKWTFYDIRVYGSTVKGQGILSANVTIQTDTDGKIFFKLQLYSLANHLLAMKIRP